MTLRRAALILLVSILGVSLSSAKKAQPVLEWKMGILWETPDPCNETSPIWKDTFLILGDDTLYHVAKSNLGRHKPNIREGDPVMYTIAEGDFYLQDEDGRVFKLAVVKKEQDATAQERLKRGKKPCQP
jgi:hypothetical protein